MVFPVSCYWVIRADARALFDKGRLVARRRVPKVPTGDLLDPNPFDRVQGLGASLQWDSITNRSRCLGNVLGYLGSVARASAM
jgi:hypothetical protein